MSSTRASDRPDPFGIPGLLLLMATATGIVAVTIAAFVGVHTWAMLGIALALFLTGTAVVVLSIGRVIDKANAADAADEAAPAAPAAEAEVRDDHARRHRARPATSQTTTRT